jgi:type II secretory pathway component GspD/PulD (secretin)
MTMIKPVLSEKGLAAVSAPAVAGIDSGSKESGGNNHATEDMLVITDYPENIERVRKVLKDIDHRPQQVLVEATILRASLSDDNALGVDFSLLGGVNFSNITTAAGQITGTSTGASSSSGSGTGNPGDVKPNGGVISGGGTSPRGLTV